MYLSKLEIIGFKSFAQRIELSFDSGVTSIVGPNGCGKTNIVDAIRWALGEQRYSTLRSDKMEDVIFNGTKHRKPLGLAEVSLTIENTKGILPTEYSEVTITRRVFRSGESEYQLNKVPCRLKDILDLFMDTGMGSDAYSVIELKMVESILSDKTDERRRLFEEAAGVTKYKHRRKAALRKLEDVQADLVRVNDIVKEVQKTVSTLERQAKKAEQYNDVAVRLRTLEIDLLEREYAYLTGKLAPIEERLAGATQEKSAIDDQLRFREEEIERLQRELGVTEQRLADRQAAVARQSEQIRRIEEKILVAKERVHALENNIERYNTEKGELHRQGGALEQEGATLRQKLEHVRLDHETTAAQYARVRDEFVLAGKQADEKRSALQQLKDDVLELAHDVVHQRGEQERVKARIDNLIGRIDRSREDNALYESDITRIEEEIGRLSTHDRELRRRFAEAEHALGEQEATKRGLYRSIDGLQKELLELDHAVEQRQSKIEFLRRMIESNEGYAEGARYLLGQARWKEKQLTTVADAIEVPGKYRKAIETALADVANLLIVDTIEDGRSAVEELKRQGRGEATFICLEWVPRIRRRRKKTAALPYVWAPDVVQCEDRYRPLVQFLLDDVVIVDAPGVAKEIFAGLTGVRCISVDGETLSTTGIIRGGSVRHVESSLIGKRSQIAELEGEIAQCRRKTAELSAELGRVQNEHDSVDVRSFQAAVKAIEKEMTATEMRIAQLEFEKKRARDGIERNAAEISSVEEEIGELRREHEAVGAEVVRLEESRRAQDALCQQTARELEVMEARLAEQSRMVNELEIRVVTLEGEVRSTERDIDRADARLQDITVTLERRDQEIAHAREEIGRLGMETDGENAELLVLRQSLVAMEEERGSIEEEYQRGRSTIHEMELAIKDERRLHDTTTASVHELEMKASELRSSMEHLRERALEEFELTLELKSYPEDEWVDFAQRREEVKNLKERIRVLGAINFAAFDEFKTESERLAFLTQQRNDLLEAEKTLLDTIEEINTTAQRIFLETFGKIRTNFITIFKELFLEGDECDLKIEENVDPLEATIEIIAKPRGKRPTSIDLLSGGEKTLTAIALLFAIYLVKPSPFCILDEVDAPLDDSNIDRFTRILRKFSNNTQFIVVTHNKRTMEAASALYGVTMEEEGVSKIVTVRFNEEARVRSATVTN